MNVMTAAVLSERIMKVATSLDCKNIGQARLGKADGQTDRDVFELMFIHEFLPYWSYSQLWQKACYLNLKYGV